MKIPRTGIIAFELSKRLGLDREELRDTARRMRPLLKAGEIRAATILSKAVSIQLADAVTIVRELWLPAHDPHTEAFHQAARERAEVAARVRSLGTPEAIAAADAIERQDHRCRSCKVEVTSVANICEKCQRRDQAKIDKRAEAERKEAERLAALSPVEASLERGGFEVRAKQAKTSIEGAQWYDVVDGSGDVIAECDGEKEWAETIAAALNAFGDMDYQGDW